MLNDIVTRLAFASEAGALSSMRIHILHVELWLDSDDYSPVAEIGLAGGGRRRCDGDLALGRGVAAGCGEAGRPHRADHSAGRAHTTGISRTRSASR